MRSAILRVEVHRQLKIVRSFIDGDGEVCCAAWSWETPKTAGPWQQKLQA
jgi:hypothetical protein